MISITKLTAALFVIGTANAVYFIFAEQDPIAFLRQPAHVVFFLVPMLLVVGYLASFLGQRDRSGWRTVLIVLASLFIIGAGLGRSIVLRHSFDRLDHVNDGVIQTEEAARFVRHGANPYAADYRPTAFGRYGDYFSLGSRPNPAWNHYVYLPGAFLLAAPFQSVSERALGWFDARLVYCLLWLAGLALLARLTPRPYRDLAIILTALNPLALKYFILGLNDFTILFYLLAAAAAMKQGKIGWSSLAVGLAVATKQSAWLFVPLYLIWVIRSSTPRLKLEEQGAPADWRRQLARLWPGAALAIGLIGTFFIWSPSHFIDDIWRFPSGSADWSYPSSGFGLGQWLVSSGIVKSQFDYWPAGLVQLAVGLPLLGLVLKRQWCRNTLSNLFWHYGLLLFGVWLAARYFNDTHLTYLSLVLLVSVFITDEAKAGPEKPPVNSGPDD